MEGKDYAQRRRDKLRLAGICHSCGTVPPEQENGVCASCREKQKERQRKHDRKTRELAAATGMCLCGRGFPLPDLKICEACRDRNYKQYRRRVKLGICECSMAVAEGKTKCQECLDSITAKRKEERSRVLLHYGNSCNCCGESIERFLTVDHVHNDGSSHRKVMKTDRIYSWLIRNNFPAGFQVLCYNCNCGRQLNGGICPHQQLMDTNHE